MIGARAAAASLLALSITSAAAAREPARTVGAFYDALRTANGPALAAVLAEDAVIRLADLGFDMNREEFVDSMDVWADVASDMTLRIRPDPTTPDGATRVVRIVCYEFPSNVSLTREVTTLRGDLIIRNEQEEIGTACEGF